MRIATWNVLHRIHAENWREKVPDVFPDEAVRIVAITARIAALLAEGDGDDVVVCLQEVSGDQLASLRAALPAMQVCAFIYPRVPSLKQPVPSPLQHPEEALVTIAARARLVASAVFPNDPGKGFLVVDVDGVLVINTHLSAGDRRTIQLQHIKAHIDHSADQCSAVVVCGDCNTSSAKVLAGLDGGFDLVDLGLDALPTRPRPDLPDRTSDKPAAIDHIVVRGLVAEGGVVVDVAGTSDHNLVRATVRQP